jgi:hypothetical protein
MLARVWAYVLPLSGREDGMDLLSFPLPIIVEAGGVVGASALETTTPIGLPFCLLLFVLRRIILRWVGFVMLRKYCGFLHHC